MATSLFSIKNLLLVTGAKLSLADYLSLTVLVEVMQRAGVNMDLATVNPLPQNLTSIVGFPNIKKIDKMPARKFVLTFDKGSDSVKNVQWQQTDQKVSIHISMEKGQFKADGLNVSAEGANYDAILYYNVGNFSEVEKFFADFPAVVHEVKNLSLGNKFSINNAKVEILDDENTASLPETVYGIVKGQGSNAEQHTRLLAAIFAVTNRFRQKVNKAETFKICAELVNSGANLEQANSLSDKTADKKPAPAAPANPNAQPPKQPESAKPDPKDPLPAAQTGSNSHAATQIGSQK